MTDKSYRREDERLLTGRGCYTADWNLPRQLYAHFCAPIERTRKFSASTPRRRARARACNWCSPPGIWMRPGTNRSRGAWRSRASAARK